MVLTWRELTSILFYCTSSFYHFSFPTLLNTQTFSFENKGNHFWIIALYLKNSA